MDIFSGTPSSDGIIDFPAKIHATYLFDPSVNVLYVPQEYCYINVTMNDDHIVGHSECSKCGKNVDLFIKFCPHCGAKVKGRKVMGED